MKKYWLAVIVLIIIAIGYIFKYSRIKYYQIYGEAQGTYYMVKFGTSKDIDLAPQIKNVLDQFDQSLSTYKTNSIISGINTNDTSIVPDEKLTYVFVLSREIYELTDGAFDITVAPLVNAYGFGWKEEKLPSIKDVDSIMKFIGMNKVSLSDGKIYKDDPRIQLDVNAIAQGYSVDLLAEFLDQQGIQDYLIDVGGELKALGKNQNGQYWAVGVEKPLENTGFSDRQVEVKIGLNNMALATSGNYRKFYEKNGIKYVHTINPVNGQMVQSNLLSVTVLNKECARADALATSFMVLGLEKSKSLLAKLKDTEAFFIYTDENGEFKEWYTSGFKSLVVD